MHRIVAGAIVALLLGSATLAQTRQAADPRWLPEVAAPAYATGGGPVVLVDAAHGNFRTFAGRYRGYADLLRQDGCQVHGADEPASETLLQGAAVYIVSNAITGGDNAEWNLPFPGATAWCGAWG